MRDAIAANVFRYDASDMMPPEIGSVREDGSLGAFWRGMQDYADGIRTLPEVLADIEEEWTALEAEGG